MLVYFVEFIWLFLNTFIQRKKKKKQTFNTFLSNNFIVCGFACHVTCQEKVPAVCPVPSDQSNYLHNYSFFK